MPLRSLIDGAFGFIGNAQQNKYNKELAAQQNAFNLEMWNKQNEYNSPIETIKRLTDAGVNPRSYNNLGQFANSADAPHAVSYDKKSPLSAFSDIAMTALQMKNLQADTDKKVAEADKAYKEGRAAQDNARTNSRRLDSDISNRLYEIGIKQDHVRLAIMDGMRRSWMYGDNVGGLGQFNTKFDDGWTLNESLFGILTELKELERDGFKMDYESKKLLNGLREMEGQLKEGEVQSFENIPREMRWWLAPLFQFLISR